MSSSSLLILVIGILVAALLVIAGFVIPIFLTTGARPRSGRRTRAFADSPASHLIMGFTYLFPPIDFSRSRGSVQRRMERAFQRVDVVDPYAAPRRIGTALLQAGLVDSENPLPPAAEPDEPWAPGEAETLWTSGAAEPELIWSLEEPKTEWPHASEDQEVPPPQTSQSGPIWAQAEPDAEFGSEAAEPGAQDPDQLRHEQRRDEE